MKKKILASFIIGTALLLPTFILAAGPSIPETGLPDSDIKEIIENILKWLLGIVGILALISFAISGIMYLLSAGDDDLAEKGKAGLKYSIYGIIVVLSAFVVIQAVDLALRASDF
ncbi:MAG: pilin [Patescibacteria group bacterium]